MKVWKQQSILLDFGIQMMVYALARVGAVVTMRIEDYYQQGRRWWLRLHEKGGKLDTMPCPKIPGTLGHVLIQTKCTRI